MNVHHRWATTALLVAASFGVSSAANAVSTYYDITDLGTLGGDFSYATDINDRGQVVGGSSVVGSTDQHAFLYSNSTMSDLGTPPGRDYSGAVGISNSGQIAVNAEYTPAAGNNYDSDPRAFLYSNGTFSNLGTLGTIYSYALGINDSGQVVGKFDFSGGTPHAFLYSNGTMSDLGATLGGISSAATDINKSGQIVGYSETVSINTFHAFLYSNGTMSDLGTLGGTSSLASGINDSGQVVGVSSIDAGDTASHAFLYSNGTMTNLGSLSGNSSATAINNSGQVVGYSDTIDGAQYASLFSDGAVLDLNNLITPGSGWLLTEASDINDLGQIVGTGSINGQTHAYLATPYSVAAVPAPAAVWLLGSGLLGLVGMARRKA